jgi:AcrR family transcriptional regulator
MTPGSTTRRTRASGRPASSRPARVRAGATATSKGEDTRRKILETALELFQERGFAETTMRDVARHAGVATGAAYYYFPSKESIVMAFYWRTQVEADALSKKPFSEIRDLKDRVRALIDVKLKQFGPYRGVFGALFRSAGDPASPLSPFSEETREIREQSIGHFREALEGSDVKVPPDLARHLPYLLWLYQLGIILFWIYDRSARQARTQRLLDGTLDLIVRLIRLARIPVLAPLRKAGLRLLESLMVAGVETAALGGAGAASVVESDRKP